MNILNKSAVILLTAVLLPWIAEASEGSVGNGGAGVICRNPRTGAVISSTSMLIDLFEGANPPLSLVYPSGPQAPNSVDDWIGYVEQRMSIAPQFLDAFKKELANYRVVRKPVNSDTELAHTFDIQSPLRKRNCPKEQVVNYFSQGNILYNSEVYGGFNEMNQAATDVHEAVGAVVRAYRSPDDATASYVRKIVAILFSKNGDLTLIASLEYMFPVPPRESLSVQIQVKPSGDCLVRFRIFSVRDEQRNIEFISNHRRTISAHTQDVVLKSLGQPGLYLGVEYYTTCQCVEIAINGDSRFHDTTKRPAGWSSTRIVF